MTFFLLFSLCPGAIVFAATSNLIANYPATNGAYNKVMLTPTTTNCNSGNVGLVYMDNTVASSPTLVTCAQIINSSGTLSFMKVPYYETCFNIFWNSTQPVCPSGYAAATNYSPDSFSTDSGKTTIKSTTCCSQNTPIST